ncbi:nuclear migration protein Jnm1p [Trichomonascus vanleenenianus]|uniref:Jnm1p n=1 Tax=Trichomonascus vanleenenianus TaxID=2268995 RepID=UPI003ECA47E1
MSGSGSKYSELPDIDISSQVVYETTIQDTSLNNGRQVDDGREDEAIDSSRLSRSIEVFETCEVDASETNFSGRLDGLPSYRTKHVPESVSARIARLRREVEELQTLQGATKKEKDELGQLAELKSILDSYATTPSKPVSLDYTTLGSIDSLSTSFTATATLDNGRSSLAKIAELEKRVSDVEKIVGYGNELAEPLQPLIADLKKKMSLVNASPEVAESSARKFKDLALLVEKLKSTKQKKPGSSGSATTGARDGEDTSTAGISLEVRRIESIYQRLVTIDSMAAIVPRLADRLRTLQAVHADTASTVNSVRNVDATLNSIREELKSWKQCLETVETQMAKLEQTAVTNKKEIKQWISKLENSAINR